MRHFERRNSAVRKGGMSSHMGSMQRHDTAVAKIARDVRVFYDDKRPFRIFHGSTNSTRPPAYRRSAIIDTSGLKDVLEIDPVHKTVLVEPNVRMDTLAKATLGAGFLPLVTMELPAITAGGGYAGLSGESSSFRYGLFSDTVNSVEVVLANGKVVRASSEQNADLFYACGGSLGTLGVVTSLELRLMEAGKYVELTYYPFKSTTSAFKQMQNCMAENDVQFVDGISYGPQYGCIMAGRLTNVLGKDQTLQRFSRPQDPWFYVHAERMLKRHTSPFVVTIPVLDYLFRYDRGAFWGGYYAFKYFITPFNRITRFVLDRFMRAEVMFHALHESGLADKYIVQDIAVPFSNIEKFLSFLDQNFGSYPLWLCPIRRSLDPSTSPITTPALGNEEDMVINVGIWCPGPANRDAFARKNRELEQKTHELQGSKCLYARTYYTEEEFWNVYDRGRYLSLREKYYAHSLPTIYDKVKAESPKHNDAQDKLSARFRNLVWSIWPFNGLWGVLQLIRRSDFMFLQDRSDVKLKDT